MAREYHAPPGYEPSVKLLPEFREQAIRDRWGAELGVLMGLYNRHGHEAVKRHLSRIRAILVRHTGEGNARNAA